MQIRQYGLTVGRYVISVKKEIPSLEKRLNETNLTDDMLKNNVTYFIAQDNRTIGEPYTKLYQNGEVNLYYYKNGH